jgi:tetratricopeptide (TPR) repeat protein
VTTPTRALAQIVALPGAAALRRKEINLQVALINPLIHVNGYAAPETKAPAERARLLIEQAEACGEPPEDPLTLFSVLYSFSIANHIVFNGDALREDATQFLALAEKKQATVPLMIGRRLIGNSLLLTGDIAQGRAHYDQAVALYNPVEHRQLATRFGQDVRVSILSFRSWALWMLGYPEAALAGADHALKDAREIGQAATLMLGLQVTLLAFALSGNYGTANAIADELVALGNEKGSLYWKAEGMLMRDWLLASTGKPQRAAGRPQLRRHQKDRGIAQRVRSIAAQRRTNRCQLKPTRHSVRKHAKVDEYT